MMDKYVEAFGTGIYPSSASDIHFTSGLAVLAYVVKGEIQITGEWEVVSPNLKENNDG
jgi:hypothetical protein